EVAEAARAPPQLPGGRLHDRPAFALQPHPKPAERGPGTFAPFGRERQGRRRVAEPDGGVVPPRITRRFAVDLRPDERVGPAQRQLARPDLAQAEGPVLPTAQVDRAVADLEGFNYRELLTPRGQGRVGGFGLPPDSVRRGRFGLLFGAGLLRLRPEPF